MKEQKASDKIRTHYLSTKSIKIIRYTNKETMDYDKMVLLVSKALEERRETILDRINKPTNNTAVITPATPLSDFIILLNFFIFLPYI